MITGSHDRRFSLRRHDASHQRHHPRPYRPQQPPRVAADDGSYAPTVLSHELQPHFFLFKEEQVLTGNLRLPPRSARKCLCSLTGSNGWPPPLRSPFQFNFQFYFGFISCVTPVPFAVPAALLRLTPVNINTRLSAFAPK